MAGAGGLFRGQPNHDRVLRRPGKELEITGLTAYDAQRLEEMSLEIPPGQAGSYAIVGTLALYLDFINLFLFVLRFVGHRRD